MSVAEKAQNKKKKEKERRKLKIQKKKMQAVGKYLSRQSIDHLVTEFFIYI